VKENQEEKKMEAFSHQHKLFILRSDNLGFLASIHKMKAQRCTLVASHPDLSVEVMCELVGENQH
jgi:hypothetical protein